MGGYAEEVRAPGVLHPTQLRALVADAADVSQPTFTILVQILDSLDDSRLGAWLLTVARRHTWRLMQRRREGTGKGRTL